MVLVRRKRVLYHDIPTSLLETKSTQISTQADPTIHSSPKSDADCQVFYIPETGEIFLDYESYAARITFLKLNVFMCEVTGKSGLDYFQATDSERNESTVLHARFPEQLKSAVLRAVQWQIVGRLDHLVEAVYDRYKDRYFKGEKVYVDVQGDKYLARIVKVFPPRNLKTSSVANGTHSQTPSPLKLKIKLTNGGTTPTPSSPSSPTDASANGAEAKPFSKYRPAPNQRVARSYPSDNVAPNGTYDDVKPSILDPTAPAPSPESLIHTVGTNLKLSLEEANQLDDPAGYFYSVQMIGEGEMESTDTPTATDASKYAGSEMEVTCSALSRDRLGFNKALLKRFLKDALERDNAIASPWIVKSALAEKYGIETEMPKDVREGVEGVKKADHEKRKRIWEEREGRDPEGPNKKRKLGDEEKAARAAQELKRQQELELMEAAAEDALKKAAAAKKRGVRYPTEDLDVKFTDRDRKAGKLQTRPPLDRDLPFGVAFEGFITSWNFLNTFGKALDLSPFTLDEYEKAIRHSLVDPACRLVGEIHLRLINLVKEREFEHQAALESFKRAGWDENCEEAEISRKNERDEDWQVEIDELVEALEPVGNGWVTTLMELLSGSEDREEGWEVVLVGCLKDYARIRNFPRLRPILTFLVYGPHEESEETVQRCHPADRYPHLPPEDKITIISFLCEMAIPSKPIRTAMDQAESELTELRKEKIEVNRERKKLQEELAHTNAGDGTAPLTMKNVETNAKAASTEASVDGGSDMDVDSDRLDASSDVGSEFGGSSRAPSTVGTGRNVKNDSSNPGPKFIALARERAIAREKAAELKAAESAHRRKDDDVAKLDRRLEAIERQFRQMLGIGRSRPLGRDRFYNRIWWFDGLGGCSLLGHSGNVAYGTGRIFIQGPSEVDMQVLEGREEYKEEIIARRVAEEGSGMVLAPGEWGCYQDAEQFEQFMTWLNVKGHREFQLDRTLKLWWDYILPGMRKRQADLAAAPPKPEIIAVPRRNARAKAEVSRESYMTWTNKRAKSQHLK